ncbi:cation channel protein, putative [Bodo saltans]|uniref:Cation channel protein, putative n=1 Tax=Bodo saltans TaxID=75058 RepID=A0A0S4JJR4_BODSA|nr:cation channel protein, putative [Bodo saltans]|eukprot:CUG90504.1 cation channel protein, putative [Bodo saltans]
MRLRTLVQERRGHNTAAAQNNALRQSIDMGDNAALMATTASLAQTNRKAAGKKDQSLKASEDVLLEMRLRTVVQERRGHNSAAAQNNALRQSIDMGDNAALMATTASLAQTNRKAAGKKDPAAVFLDKLDTFHRRLFLAILACSPIMEGAVLKEKIKLCDEKDDAAAREPPPAATPAETASSSVLGAVRNAFELFIPSFRVTFPVALSPFRASKDLVLTHESFTKLCEHNSVLTTFLAKSHDDYTDYMNYKHPRGLKSGTASPPSGSPLTAAQPANPNQADGAAAPSDATEVPKRRAQVAWANASYNEKDTHDAAATGQQKHSFQQLLTIEKLVNTLLIPETSNIRLEDFRIHVYEEFGEQALSFGLSIKDTQSIEWYLERRAERQQLKKVKQQQRDLGQPVVRGGHNNNALPQLVVQGSNDLVPQREVSEIDMPKSSANSMNVDEDSDALLVTLRGDEHLEDVAANDPASFYILEEREFDEAWKAAKRTSPPDEVKDRVFSVFPTTGDGKKYVDMRMFLKFCRESVHAHKNVSFSRHYCLAEEQRFHSVMWILFYIPLFVVTLFFLFYKNPLGDTIWISQGLSTSFAASSGATSLADIETWMASCVKSIFPLPNEPAATHNNANFYVGTMRFRQHRVDPDDCSQQYLDYFGDPDTTTLRFPEGISPSEKISYTSRVQRDYSGLFSNQECYGAYDFGASKSTQGYLRANNVQYPEVATAFTYQDTGVSNSIDAFDSHYSSGGFVFDVNYTVDGSYATSAVTNLINALWLDNATRVVVLEIIVLNTNVAVLARGRFGIELTGGGAYEPFSSVYVARTSYPTNGLFRLFQAIAILIILIYITVVMYTYVTHVRQHISMFGENYAVAAILGIFEDLGVPWDVAIIALMIASFTLRFYAAAGDSFDTIYNNGKWATDVENALEWAKTLKQVEGVNGFMVFVRFLYFIGLNERRLAIVLDTLRVSVVDLVSILALWIMALCACTLAAVICFGYGATEAFNFQSAFFDLYNSASGGNPNYYDYTAARRETAPVFWILYFVVTFFVLYNMVVAVLTSKFADVKAQTFGFETVNRVMMQEASEEWYSRFGEYKHRLWSGFVIQEARQVFLRIRYGWMVQGPPLRLRCENPRSCWTYMVKTWNTLDMGIPVDVVEAAIALMTLELTVAQENGRWEHIRDIVEKQRTLGKLGATIKFATVAQGSGSHRPHVSPTSPVQEGETAPLGERGASNIIEEAAAAAAAPGPRIEHTNRELITYADRRLPLWEEYIYYVFKGERDLVQRYLIGLPSHLLSWRLPKLWRHAVESEHYFTLLRSSYTVDLSESRVVQLTKILPNVDEIEASLLQSVTVDGTALQQQPSPARQRV